MTLETEKRSSLKACPWWARFATAPNGWVVTYCSFNACEDGKRKRRIWEGPPRIWEGPPKAKRCMFGYNKLNAINDPMIIFYRPQTGQIYTAQVADRWISNKAWNSIVEWFSREVAGSEDPPSFDSIETTTRILINQAWST